MTTATATLRPAPRFPWLLLALGIVALAIILSAQAGAFTRHQAVIFSAHATVKHSEAPAIRHACDNGGELQRWQANENSRKFFRLCQTPGGLVGLQIIECTARGPRERSAFTPGKSQLAAGSMARALEYVSAKAHQVVIGGLCK